MSLWKPSRSRKGRNSRSRAMHFNAPASPDEIQIPEQIHPSAPNTTLSALKFTLQTLSSISTHIPIGAGLAIVIDTFLAVMTRIEQTSVNAQGLAQLVERIQLLTPIIVSETASPTSKGRVVEALKQELQAITEDLEAFSSRGKLQQFFDSTEHAGCLAKHNMSLMQIVSTATLANVQDIREILKNVEFNDSLTQPTEIGRVEVRDITGGFGAMGGYGRCGGEGGEGEGPRLEIEFGEHLRFGKISGGAGGAGGPGAEVGGKGGTGKGPVINMLRRNRVLVVDPMPVQDQQMESLTMAASKLGV